MNLFDCTFPPLKIDKPIRLIELFAGIGAQAKALENLGVPFEHYRICEFDKYAVASYNAVHKTNFQTSDITQIHASDLTVTETEKYCYILTYSFPCQDLSNAGKQRGMTRGGRHTKWAPVGSRASFERNGRAAANPCDGECSGSRG